MTTGLDALFQLIAALQAIILALGAFGTPVSAPPPPPMNPPPMNPPPPLPPPVFGCEVSRFPLVDLGEAYFLPSGQTDPRFPGLLPIGYPDERIVDGWQDPNPTCAFPGVRLMVLSTPVTPLQFTNVPPITAKVIPVNDSVSIGLVASDTKQVGFCRPGRPFETGTGSDCISFGDVGFIYGEMPFDPLNPPMGVVEGVTMTWTGFRGTTAISRVTLDIFTPSTALIF